MSNVKWTDLFTAEAAVLVDRSIIGPKLEIPMEEYSAIRPGVANQGLLSVVVNVPVPENLQVFPTFRSWNGGQGGSLWLWDGSESFRLARD